MGADFDRRTFISAVPSTGLISLAGCSILRSDDALDLVVENERSRDHEMRAQLLGGRESFEETTTVDADGEVTFEDAVTYPEHPEVVTYNFELLDYPLDESGTFALSDELERFGFRIVDSDRGDPVGVLTLKDFRD